MNEKFAPNNIAALILIVAFFSMLSVDTGRGSREEETSSPEETTNITQERRDDTPAPARTLREKTLEEVLEYDEIGRWDDSRSSVIPAESFAPAVKNLKAEFLRIKYRKRKRILQVEMGIDTTVLNFSECSEYVHTHRREVAARFFIAYRPMFSGLVDKIIEENIPVCISVKYGERNYAKGKNIFGDVVEQITYADRRELIDACGIMPPELKYDGKLDLEEWRNK